MPSFHPKSVATLQGSFFDVSRDKEIQGIFKYMKACNTGHLEQVGGGKLWVS